MQRGAWSWYREIQSKESLKGEAVLRKEETAENINILGRFCGKRDVESLTSDSLENTYGFRQADVMVLFGGSVLCGGDVLAQAMKNGIAKQYIIVGGVGHTTETLRQKVQEELPMITAELTEAEVFGRYLETVYGLKADYLETQSTNCGNNITNLLALLKAHKIAFRSIILCQDATMQYRMEAGLRKYVSEDITIINFAAYKAEVAVRSNRLAYQETIHGMWEIDRYVNLLMGEIPRLANNADGYGPNGKNFIAHVEIPQEVNLAFEELKKEYGEAVRKANPAYASRETKGEEICQSNGSETILKHMG